MRADFSLHWWTGKEQSRSVAEQGDRPHERNLSSPRRLLMDDSAYAVVTRPGSQRLSGPGALAIGTRVEVRNSFCPTWSPGFQVADVIDGRYRLRRISDQYDLPADFAPHQLRPVR